MPFKTNSGIEGFRLVHETAVQGKMVWNTFYSFDAPGGNKRVFTCSVIASHGAELAPIFDQIIGTYKP